MTATANGGHRRSGQEEGGPRVSGADAPLLRGVPPRAQARPLDDRRLQQLEQRIWRAIQEAMGTAGFVVADVRTLDKKQGSYRQVTSSAVKQDLVISAYKPTEALTHRFELGHATADGAWAFVKEHLGNVPVFVGRASEGEVVAERTAQMLLDRMIAFHVQRGYQRTAVGSRVPPGASRSASPSVTGCTSCPTRWRSTTASGRASASCASSASSSTTRRAPSSGCGSSCRTSRRASRT